MRIDEVMNRTIVSVRPGDSRERVLEATLQYGVTAVPVLDDERRVLGIVSLRDLLGEGEHGYRISTPAFTLPVGTRVRDAAEIMGDRALHHVVVVDEAGSAVGMLSLIDVVRGLLGEAARHPPTFPGYDPDTAAFWTPLCRLDLDHLADAPDGPGVFALYDVSPRERDCVVWAESSEHVQQRLGRLILDPASRSGRLAEIMEAPVRFRAAAEPNAEARAHALRVLHRRHPQLPTI